MSSYIRFLGATGTVTGSKHFLGHQGSSIMVDCGMFQGHKELRELNWRPIEFHGDEWPDAVLLTHAHIDHTGYLPRLVQDGFEGKSHATAATVDLLHILLKDAAHIQEEDARYANRKGFSKHSPALPLYTTEDAEKAIDTLMPHRYEDPFSPVGGIMARFRDAGHLIGSSLIEVDLERKGWEPLRVTFSGDLGRMHKPILRDPSDPAATDYLVLESTYGDRVHSDTNPEEELARVINEAVASDSTLLVPSFAVGRTQELLYMIRDLEERGVIPAIPVMMDSPMAISASEVLRQHPEIFDKEAKYIKRHGKDIIHPTRLSVHRSVEQSKQINEFRGAGVIISASGMATGGRVVHHLVQRLPDPNTTVLFIGYQVEGTRGRQLLDGATTIKMHGQWIPVEAKVTSIDGFSGHADSEETLDWLRKFPERPRKVFIVHGTDKSSQALAQKIDQELGWSVHVPTRGEAVKLEG